VRWLILFYGDLRAKAEWCYEDRSWKAIIKTLLTDGTMAMLYYRMMQGARRWKLFPLEMLFNKLNAIFCQCIIGRGAEFGSEFVLIHSQGIVINAKVRGGNRIKIEHQVTIGAERRNFPTLADDIFIGAGAKIIGSVQIGEGAKIGANAVVIHDVPAHTTVVGIPAKVVRQREIAGEIRPRDEMKESGEFGSPFATDLQ
jgi:serine O-acetyltransferase